MEIGGLSYPEALKELGSKYNIEIKEKQLTSTENEKLRNQKMAEERIHIIQERREKHRK